MITVFTPTFNRAYTLKKLFNSLQNQTCKDFEWLIIDDGSEDETENLVNSEFIPNALFPMRYIYKQNEGKNAAINEAALLADGDYVFIVDSDDYLSDDAIETIDKYCSSIDECADGLWGGVVGLRGNSKGEVRLTEGKAKSKRGAQKLIKLNEYIDATTIDYRYHYGIRGGRAEVIKKEVLQRYPFPKIVSVILNFLLQLRFHMHYI